MAICQPWTTDSQVRQCCPGLDSEYDLTDAIDFATEVLFNLSGRQYPGICAEDEVRPCLGPNCGCGDGAWDSGWNWWYNGLYGLSGGGWGWPLYDSQGGGLLNMGGCCGGGCNLPRVRLTGPIVDVESVWVDGVELATTAYKVRGRRWLERVDGGVWPCTQDLTLPPTSPNTFAITYRWGRAVTSGGAYAAAVFVCELARARCGSECSLPPNMTSLAREGLSLSFEDTASIWTDGRVGLREVDMWLHAVNPNSLTSRAAVYRADDKRLNRRWS